MSREFTLEGNTYNIDHLSESGKVLYERLLFVYKSLEELNAQHALLMRGKNGYIEDLKSEVVEKKLGVDHGALLTDDWL